MRHKQRFSHAPLPRHENRQGCHAPTNIFIKILSCRALHRLASPRILPQPKIPNLHPTMPDTTPDIQASNNRRIAKNTVYLYFRMMLLMLVALYTSRVYLEALGIEDTGIYQVVGGVVTLFVFLNSSLSGATSRFLTYELGRGDRNKLSKVFSTSLNIHICLALIVLALSETIGLWLLEYKLNIPDSRMNAARVVYQFSVLSCCIGIIQVPYSASIIAHEQMNVYAFVSIADALLKLLVSYLIFIIPFDRLISYGILIFIVTLSIQLTYVLYCSKKNEECHFKLFYDKTITKPMLSFSMWDVFGNFGIMMRGQGVNIILNLFFGPAINAACGFSNYAQGAVKSFSDNFMMAIRPSIVKSYSRKEYESMENYMINASKYSFCLMTLLSVPLIFETKFVIDLWLKTPPPFTYEFCAISLGINLVRTLFAPLMFGIHATGKIRNMSIANGSILFLIVPISYALLRMGFSPLIPFIVDFFLMFVLAGSCLFFLKQNLQEFHIGHYLSKATLPSLIIGILVFSIVYGVKLLYGEDSIIRFILLCLTSTISTAIVTYLVALDEKTKMLVLVKLRIRTR